jgi:hypothetical protein
MIQTIGTEFGQSLDRVWTIDTILDLTEILSGSNRGSILNEGLIAVTGLEGARLVDFSAGTMSIRLALCVDVLPFLEPFAGNFLSLLAIFW